MTWCMIEMSIKCPRCDSPVHVDGPRRRLKCGKCHSDIEFPLEVWDDLLGDISSDLGGFEPGTGTSSTIFGHFNMNMTYAKMVPYCMDCKRDFEMDDDWDSCPMVTCPQCGSTSPVQHAPEWLSGVLPKADLVVGAWPEDGGETPLKEVSGPVAYSCPQCAGSLMIDGSTRIIECDYCSTNVYLPDDLWLALHPVRKKTRWFIGLRDD